MQAAEQAKTLAMAQGQMADNLSWANRVQSLQDDVDLYTYINATNQKLGNEVQVLTNQICTSPGYNVSIVIERFN